MLSLVLLTFLQAARAEDLAAPDVSGQGETGTPLDNTRTLVVVGTGEVDIAPDQAVLNLGVRADATTAQAAFAAAADAATQIVNALRARVPEEALRSTRVSLQPRYEQQRGNAAPKLIGYTAGTELAVRVDDPNQLGDVLDAAIAAGANDVESVEYRVRNPQAARDEALANAVADARAIAEKVATGLGVTIGQAMKVTVNDESPPVPRGMRMERAGADTAMAAEMPVLPGETRWVSRVSVTFELTPAQQPPS